MKLILRKLQNALNAIEKGRLKQAEILLLECIDKIEDQTTEPYKQTIHGLAFVKSESGNFSEAQELYFELLRMAREEGNQQEEAIALHQLGMVQRLAGNDEQALHYLKEERNIYLSLGDNFHLGLAANFYEQGIIFMRNDQLQLAEQAMGSALEHGTQADDLTIVGHASDRLGDILARQDNKKEAFELYQRSLTAFQQSGNEQAVKRIGDKLDEFNE